MLASSGSLAEDQIEARQWLGKAAQAGEPAAALRMAELLLDEGKEFPHSHAGGRALEGGGGQARDGRLRQCAPARSGIPRRALEQHVRQCVASLRQRRGCRRQTFPAVHGAKLDIRGA